MLLPTNITNCTNYSFPFIPIRPIRPIRPQYFFLPTNITNYTNYSFPFIPLVLKPFHSFHSFQSFQSFQSFSSPHPPHSSHSPHLMIKALLSSRTAGPGKSHFSVLINYSVNICCLFCKPTYRIRTCRWPSTTRS